MKKKIPEARSKPLPNYVRAWRKHRKLTLEQLAERLGVSHATISRIERGAQNTSDSIFDSLARELQTDKASLFVRDPTDPDGIWAIWDVASEAERKQIVEIAKALIRARREG